jgi:hypothetical protein
LSTNLILNDEIVKKILTKKLVKAKKKKKQNKTKGMKIKFERKIAKKDEIEKKIPNKIKKN